MTREITIAGGGLAGLSLGIALRRRGIPVCLHEAGSYPRHRVCGEFISGVRPATLAVLGIDDILSAGVVERSLSWHVRERLVYRGVLPEPATGLSRYKLDEALRARFEALGGQLLTGSRLPAGEREGQIWCAGRKPGPGEWIGLKCHARRLPMEVDLEMHAGRGAYVGLARVEEGIVNICGLFRRQREKSSGPLLPTYLHRVGLGALAERLSAAEVDEDSRAAVAGFRLGWQKMPSDRFVLGDSLAMIPPFTGNGMSMAFESAEAALDPLTAYAAGGLPWADAWRQTRDRLSRRFSTRLFWARLLHPGLTSPLGQVFFTPFSRCGIVPLCFKLLR